MKRLAAVLFAAMIIAGVGLVLTPKDANSWDYLRFLYQWKAFYTGAGGGEASCTSCTSETDSKIVDAGYTTSSTMSDGSRFQAQKFTIASTTCVTGVFIESTDEAYGGGAGATGMIYDNTGSSPEAGCPGSMVASCTATVANLSNDVQENEFVFASTVTLPAGTYFVVWDDEADANAGFRIGATGAPDNTFYYSADGSTWTESTYHRNMGVIGCTPE